MKEKEKLKRIFLLLGLIWMGIFIQNFLSNYFGEEIIINRGVSLGLVFGGELTLSMILWLAMFLILLREKKMSWGWFLILAGGGVNGWDRFNFGFVRDYWKLPFFNLYNNFADWWIFVGIMMVMIDYIFKKNNGKNSV